MRSDCNEPGRYNDPATLTHLSLIGQSDAFRAAMQMMQRLAKYEATVLIQGEIGTGKELAARGIHYLGPRRDQPFIPVNCGAVPDTLLENELFGHVRGAFTDARDVATGLIAAAERGTLFLDEVEALSPKGQVVLLRFLQDRMYRPLGGKRLIDADVRIIAASNADLREMVAQQRFRADLMYRLVIMPLELPPLRDRAGDVRLLAQHFVMRFNAQYRHQRRLSAASIAALEAYTWPGNVRELENLLHREVLLADGEVLDITSRLPRSSEPAPAATARRVDPPVFEHGFRAAKASWIASFEREFVSWALAKSGGNVSAAARHAGKERRSFSRLIKKHGLDRVRFIAS